MPRCLYESCYYSDTYGKYSRRMNVTEILGYFIGPLSKMQWLEDTNVGTVALILGDVSILL